MRTDAGLALIERAGKLGLGTAYQTAFRRRPDRGRRRLHRDDGRRLLARSGGGPLADRRRGRPRSGRRVAIHRGRSVSNWHPGRRLLSVGGNLYARLITLHADPRPHQRVLVHADGLPGACRSATSGPGLRCGGSRCARSSTGAAPASPRCRSRSWTAGWGAQDVRQHRLRRAHRALADQPATIGRLTARLKVQLGTTEECLPEPPATITKTSSGEGTRGSRALGSVVACHPRRPVVHSPSRPAASDRAAGVRSRRRSAARRAG